MVDSGPEPENIYEKLQMMGGAWGSVVFNGLRYNSEGPGIDSQCRRGFSRGI